MVGSLLNFFFFIEYEKIFTAFPYALKNFEHQKLTAKIPKLHFVK